MTAPIIEAIRLVRFAIVPTLSARSGGRGVYWLARTDEVPDAFPFVVVQSQDGGGQSDRMVGAVRWRGLITVKALAQQSGSNNAQATAEALLEAVAPGMDNLTAPAGFVIDVRAERPIVIPPLDGVWQAAHLWLVRLERA